MCLSQRLQSIALAALASGLLGWPGLAAEPARASDYEVRTFEGGPGWFVYGEAVDVALHVLRPTEPKCHEIGEIILLFDSQAQLRDPALIETAALTGMARYAELCRALGAKPSNQRKVVGVIAGDGQPDTRGRFIGESRILDAFVSSLTGEPRVTVRRNAEAAGNRYRSKGATVTEADEKPAAGQATRNAAEQRQAALISEIRATYDAALAESMAKAQPPGVVGRLAGGNRAALSGTWSGSQAECATERLVLFGTGRDRKVEWWRASNADVGLLPWRAGHWEIRDGTVIMTFDHRVAYDDFLSRLRTGPIEETVQFEFVRVTSSELRLAATSGAFSPEALFLGGAEKLFVRCH
jgi:hypothetical protein